MRFFNLLFIVPILYGAFSCKDNSKKRPSKALHFGEVKSLDTIITDSSSVSYPGPYILQVYTRLKNGNEYWPWLFKTIDLKMYINIAKENPEWADPPPDSCVFKRIYNYNSNDSLILNAIFSTVKYYGEYYIVAFPSKADWSDFTPPTNKDGSFLYKPIAFHLDTVNYELTRLAYNERLEIHPRNPKEIKIYARNKYGFQFNWEFAFSKRKKEFVFGKKKYDKQY